ncbi:MAG: glycosyltransferase family 2 protein [Deltaproteobacteria bacterium]|nr:glycosyltransferase family 2 protein [Deltaproteobacteria bacterium]
MIIVNWNTGKQLQDCLDSIADADQKTFELKRVVVVDNASTDGSADRLSATTLPLLIIKNPRNLGFAAACNQGANCSSADYLLFLNPDTRLYRDSLTGPLAAMLQPVHQKTGIMGIQLMDDAGRVSRSCARFPTPLLFFHKMTGLDRLFPAGFVSLAMTDWNHLHTRIVDQVIGAFFLVRNPVYRELNGFDERFFVYYEELDFSFRAFQKGWRTCYLSGFQAYHKGGGASAAVKDIRLHYALRSQILYGFKHFQRVTAFLLMLGVLFIEPWTRLGNAVLIESSGQLCDTLKAYAMLWKDLPNWFRLCLKVSGMPSSPEARNQDGL